MVDRPVEVGCEDAGVGAGEHVHVRLQLQGATELRLPAFPRGSAALQGREGAADEEAEDAVWVLRAGGVSFRGSLFSFATLRC